MSTPPLWKSAPRPEPAQKYIKVGRGIVKRKKEVVRSRMRESIWWGGDITTMHWIHV